MNKLSIVLIVAMILAIIGFVLSGIVNATAQEGISQNNSTIMDNQETILNWLETNNTKTNSAPVISISDKDFWMVFGPLIEQSINGSTSSLE